MRPLRTVLPTLAIAVGLSLPSPDALAANSQPSPVGLAAAPYVLANFLAPPDVGLPPPPTSPPLPKPPTDDPPKDEGGGGGGGIAGGPAPGPSGPPVGGAPPAAPPGGSAPPAAPTPPAGISPGAPTPPAAGPPGISAPGVPAPPGGVDPNLPTPPDAGLDQGPGGDEGPPKTDEKKPKEKKNKKEKKEKNPKDEKREDQPDQDQQRDPGQQQQQPPQQYQWPYPYPPPHIIVSPQIQVQVNPDMNVVAEPKANADADANANANAKANPTSTATADIDTKIESKQVIDGQSTGSGTSPAPVAGAPAGEGPMVEEHVIQLPPPGNDRDPLVGWRTPRRGALITGIVLFGISYGSSAFTGYKLAEGCGSSNDFVGCRRTARNMFIPVAGPAMNFQTSTTNTTRFAMAFTSGAQATGALLTVIGAAIVHRDRRRNRILEEAAGVRLSDNVTVGSGFGPRGGQVRLTAKF